MSVLQAQIDDLLIAPLCFVVLAGYGWIQWWTARPLDSVILTTVAIITILHAWKKILPLKSSIKHLRLGRDGERLVGQMLEQLRQKGYRVFHDIPGPGFNIDHAIVGAAGIFTIETKMRTKPARGRSKIFYDGTTLRMEGKAPFDEPLNQVRAQARWLANILNDGCATGLKVRPILVFPEWYVERTGHRSKDDVWVLNPKALDKRGGPSCLDSMFHSLSGASQCADYAAVSRVVRLSQYTCSGVLPSSALCGLCWL